MLKRLYLITAATLLSAGLAAAWEALRAAA
jgi:hypothetical protein